jgi:uncharacterized protein YodC (DUF2158 family)
MRQLIRLFPELAKTVFDMCITTNLQTKTKQNHGDWNSEDSVTADNANLKITFNYELIDDSYVVKKDDDDESVETEETNLEESTEWGETHLLWGWEGKALTDDAVLYTNNKVTLKRNHPLMIMVEEGRTVCKIYEVYISSRIIFKKHSLQTGTAWTSTMHGIDTVQVAVVWAKGLPRHACHVSPFSPFPYHIHH